MKLRDWLKCSGITVTVFAQIMKMDRSHIHALMSGKRNSSKKSLERLKKVTLGKVHLFLEDSSKDNSHQEANESSH